MMVSTDVGLAIWFTSHGRGDVTAVIRRRLVWILSKSIASGSKCQPLPVAL
jgi:hypothetical protein